MDQYQIFVAYKVFLRGKAIEFGMAREAAEMILGIQSRPELLALVAFLADCFDVPKETLQPWTRRRPDLYLAQGETYNEWEMA